MLIGLAELHTGTLETRVVERDSVDGMTYDRVHWRVCKGRTGRGCPWKANLRKDSKGVICGNCREGLIEQHTLVPARKARKHLLELSARGIGLRSVAFITEMSRTTLSNIKSGRSTRIGPETLDAILAVELPRKSMRKNRKVCSVCQTTHAIVERLDLLHKMLPDTKVHIQRTYPCLWPLTKRRTIANSIGERKLARDFEKLQAAMIGREEDTSYPIWGLPAKLPPKTPPSVGMKG